MAGFRLDAFSGIRPRASDVRLAVHEAVSAVDVDLRRGLLRPRPKQRTWDVNVDPALPIDDDDGSDVVLLMHYDGAEGSTALIDSSQYEHTVTAHGAAEVDTSQFKFGGSSFDATATGSYATTPIAPDSPLDIFEDDFTVECFVRLDSVTGQRIIFDYGTHVDGFRLYVNEGNPYCQCITANGWSDINGSGTIPLLTTNTWYHVAVCRQGNTGYLAVNGIVKVNPGANWTDFANAATDLYIAASANSAIHGDWLTGRVDELRVTRGLARYTSNYTVPTASFSAGGTPQTLYRFNRRSDDTDFWMYFIRDVNIVPGPAESAQQRHYYTGDVEPRMFTADSIDDTTPPYPQDADTKYPYTWFKLGVPAPADAPVLDVDEIPEPSEGSVGLITAVNTPTLTLNINLPINHSGGGLTVGACGEDGRFAGASDANILAQGGQQILTCLNAGTRMRVTEIVDVDNVKVVAAGRTGPVEVMGMIPDSSNWRWDNALPDVHKRTWLTRLNSTAKRKSYFLLPDEVTLEVEAHVLRVGDIVRITGSAAPMIWESTPEMVTSPLPATHWDNYGFRTATPDAGTVEFTGSTSFMIERDGSQIDPVVPATADFEIESRAYVYTYVSALGEESAPSPPSEIITVRVGDPVPITTFAAPPTERRNIDRIWIYRAATGSEETAFQFVGELAVDDIGDGFVDDVPTEELGEVLETEGWDVPDENMIGLVAMPNGFLAGFFDNVLCFSEPGFPHAWPPEYRKALDFDIVGIEVYGNALYVTTKGKPYIAVGVHPLQMSARHVDVIQSCADKRSIVKADDSILYCSFEGLISAGAGFVNITEGLYTKEQWQRIVGPDNAASRSLRAWYFDSQYILFATYTANDVVTTTKLIFDFRDSKEPRVTSFTEPVIAAYADPETAELFYLVAADDEPSGDPLTNTRMLLRWDYEHPDADVATEYSEGDYTTGEFRLPQPMAFSCVRVQCRRVPTAGGSMTAHGQIQLTVRARRYDNWNAATTPAEDDLVLVNAQNVINGQPGAGGWAGEQRSAPFRFDTNTLVDAVRFEIHAEGPVELETIQLGECMEDLEAS